LESASICLVFRTIEGVEDMEGEGGAEAEGLSECGGGVEVEMGWS
jgi:hypothetical protein